MTGLNIDDVSRSALALAVSAMDAYFRDKFLDRFVPFVTTHPTGLAMLSTTLVDANVSMAQVLELLGNARPLRTLRNKIGDWLLGTPMHDLARIDRLFLSYNLQDLTLNACKKARCSRTSVVKVVDRRHEIVHYADYYSGKTALKKIKPAEVRRQIEQVRRMVEGADSIINSATSAVALKRAKARRRPK